MLGLWRALQSLLTDSGRRDKRHPSAWSDDERRYRTNVVALVVSDEDRKVLRSISDRESVEIHFAESRVDAWDALTRLNSPLVLYDRDWPDAEWRTTVQAFSSSSHRCCVILASRVADDYLWQELIRCGGYDLLTKPFRPDDVARALRLALSYWKSARTAASR